MQFVFASPDTIGHATAAPTHCIEIGLNRADNFSDADRECYSERPLQSPRPVSIAEK